MNLLRWTKVTAAILGSIAVVAVVRWIADNVYSIDAPLESAYAVPGVTEPPVDLQALRRSWPQALESREARLRLLSYMRNMPRDTANRLAVEEETPEEELDLTTRLARADIANGQGAAQICAACHSLEKDEPARIGPNLWGIVGRVVAASDDFNYSEAFEEKAEQTQNWTAGELETFLINPLGEVPGTLMAFPGVAGQQDRADIIAFLNTKSDAPLPLP